MWLLVARPPLPDAPSWPGRRCLAAIDALLWPLLWVVVVRHAPPGVGIVAPFVSAMVIVYGVGRLYCALWFNHRYHFTTWRWGCVLTWILAVGVLLKLGLPA
jgi:hypothetical protein